MIGTLPAQSQWGHLGSPPGPAVREELNGVPTSMTPVYVSGRMTSLTFNGDLYTWTYVSNGNGTSTGTLRDANSAVCGVAVIRDSDNVALSLVQ
jgi:hypothetical protein